MNKLNEDFTKLYLRWKSGNKRSEIRFDEIEKYLKDYKIQKSKVHINKNDVDFDCDVSISDINDVTFKFGRVNGDFDASSISLKSMKFFPKFVGGDFNISDNALKTLEGCPEEVGGNFIAVDSYNLESLEGLPKRIGGNFLITGTDFTEDDIPEGTVIEGTISFSIRRRRR